MFVFPIFSWQLIFWFAADIKVCVCLRIRNVLSNLFLSISFQLSCYLFPFKHHFLSLLLCSLKSLFPCFLSKLFLYLFFCVLPILFSSIPHQKTLCLFSFSLCVSFQIPDSLFPIECLSVDFFFKYLQFPFLSVHQTYISLYSYLNVFLTLDITVPFLLSFFLSFSLLQFSLNIPRYLHSLI